MKESAKFFTKFIKIKRLHLWGNFRLEADNKQLWGNEAYMQGAEDMLSYLAKGLEGFGIKINLITEKGERRNDGQKEMVSYQGR